MASPQTENGYTRIANELLEALTKIRIPGEARQVFDFIIRKTYGFNQKDDAISLSQFCLATGLKKNAVCKGLAKLKGMNLITQKGYSIATIYRVNKDFSTWRPLPKKGTSTPKGERGVPQKVNKQYPKRSTTKDSKEKNKDNSADKPRKDRFETDKYPKEHYAKVLDAYQKAKGIKLQGSEFLPVMAEIKRMFKSGRTIEQIIETMEICEDNYPDWSMNTVRMKIADVVGGKLTSKNTTKNKGLVVTGRKIE